MNVHGNMLFTGVNLWYNALQSEEKEGADLNNTDLTEKLKSLLISACLPVDAAAPEEDLPYGQVVDRGDRLMFRPEHAPVLLSCASDIPGSGEILRIAGLLAESLTPPVTVSSADEMLKQLMLGRLSPEEAETLSRKYRIRAKTIRRVLLIRLDPIPPQSHALTLLKDLVPMGRTDCLVEIDRCTAAYIRDSGGEEDDTETAEFTLALCETVEEELGSRMTAGISGPAAELADLREAYRQAMTAGELGVRFRADQQVWLYERMLNERFISDLPEELCRRYAGLLANGKDALDDELMRTAVTFQSMDLNIAETSRKMGIHRNTLLYRLDKIQNLTGLDIRRFDDAMSFRLMAEMDRRLRNGR